MKPPRKDNPSIELLHDTFVLVGGDLLRKKSRTGPAQDKASAIHKDSATGYGRVKITWGGACRAYKAHRVVFAMHHGRWPQGEIDHINRDRMDNRPENLREVSRAQNVRNRRGDNSSKTGIRGVYPSKNNTYYVVVTVSNKQTHIGSFKDIELAELVAHEARRKFYADEVAAYA